MSVELKTAANIKYINIKMKKKLKKNSEIIYIIKDAGEICVKILLFLLCYENLEKIDFEFMKNQVKADLADDEEILNAVEFWKDRDILDYEITSVPNVKGPNMDNIINIILKIKRDINVLSDNEPEDPEEYDEGLGIYSNKYKNGIKEKYIEKTPEPAAEPENRKKTEETEKTEERKVPEEFDDDDGFEEITGSDEAAETEEPEAPEIKPAREVYAPQPAGQPVSFDKLIETLETKEEFRRLIQEAQIKMQTMFNTADLGILYNLFETNKMEADLIIRLAEMCVEEDKNNIRYLEKYALGTAANGILTAAEFEDKIKERHEILEYEEKIRMLFGAGNKKFTAKEKSIIKTWVKDFDFTDDMLAEGYKRCMKQIEKLSLDYINKIYTNWHEKGFKTLDDVNSEHGPNNGFNFNNNAGSKKNAGFNMDELLERAVKKGVKF